LSAGAYPFLHYGLRAFIPPERLIVEFTTAYYLATWVAVAAGLAMFGLSRSRRLKPEFVLDVGLLFEVVGAFCIGLIEAGRFPNDGRVYAGPGGIALWITAFVLVVPNTFGKTALAAFVSTLMAPAAMIVAAYANGNEPPAPFLFVVALIPNVMGAVIALVLSRFVYSLGADVSKAREMGSYKLVELLGRGGMGEVWRAQHRLLARPAAIKLIQPEMLGCSETDGMSVVERRFEREAQATAMLTSPHTIHLYDFGRTDDGAFYYVMELLHGIDLETLVEKYGPVSADRAAHFLRQICSSLEEAHQSGLVHRDIKPANIYSCRYGLEYDFAKVLDFGVVKSGNDGRAQTQLTNAATATGTPGFMAPEMALGRAIDSRADIYAVGCVAYWLLSGKLVFEEETFVATLLAHAQKPPVPVSQRTEMDIPSPLEALIMSCLEKDPQRRPSSAAEIRRSLTDGRLADSWTPERAEKWWKLHMPERIAAGAQAEIRARALQADARAD
jgi:serine/threonine-protein kinase